MAGVCIWPWFMGSSHIGKASAVKARMLEIQDEADRFEKSNHRTASSYAELSTFIGNQRSHENIKVVNLPAKKVQTLLGGDVTALREVTKDVCIAYGTTPDRCRFAVVGFDDRAHEGKPISWPSTIVLTNGGQRLILTPKASILRVGSTELRSYPNW